MHIREVLVECNHVAKVGVTPVPGSIVDAPGGNA
jgi:hypothetical protein